jgi:MFS family permease
MTDNTRSARSTHSDILLLYAARGVRGLGDGFAIIILPAYLSAIGFSPGQIGFVASASLLGTALFTLAIGFFAPRHDLRNLLLGGAVLMASTGLAFSNFDHFALIAIIAFAGTINPSTGDLGVLVPLEHAMLAHGVPDHERTHTFARYSLNRRALDGGRILGGGAAGFHRIGRFRPDQRLQDHVLCLCRAWAPERRALPAFTACAHG